VVGSAQQQASVAQECPYNWYGAMMGRGLGGEELNGTIALSECYAKAHPGSVPASPTTGSPTIATGATSRSGAKTTGPAQTMANGVVGRADSNNGMLGGAGQLLWLSSWQRSLGLKDSQQRVRL